jgi:hypothetical protein
MPSATRQDAPVERLEACAERREPRGGPAVIHEQRQRPAVLFLVMKGHEDGPARLCLPLRQSARFRLLSRLTRAASSSARDFLRKEVIQPQVPLRLPCYDFTPVADPTVAACLPLLG